MVRPQHIHIAGAGGIVTSALAAELVRLGHRVTGSDEYVLPPADAILAGGGLHVQDGYDASQVADTVDLAVVGASLKPGNPVVDEILRRKIRHLTWPRLLPEMGLLAPHNGVVAGTNGKTTTACMWAWIMEQTGRQADHVIGGKIANWPTGVRLRGAEHCVLEGDEYPCGLGDRNPKFVHYRPEVAILLNIHFDHSDVFSDVQEVERCYRLLTELVPSDGLLIYNHGDRRCRELASHARCATIGFGWKPEAGAGRLRGVRCSAEGVSFQLKETAFSLPQWGRMNALNAAAAALGAEFWGVPLAESAEALRRFPGALKRQQRLRVDEQFVLATDTAYHPAAVSELMMALQESFPGRPVGLVLNPRHTTGAANWQQDRWPAALRGASKLILMDSMNPPSGEKDVFSSAKLCHAMLGRGITVRHAEGAAEAGEHFRELAEAHEVWVLCLEEWFPQPRGEIVEWSQKF